MAVKRKQVRRGQSKGTTRLATPQVAEAIHTQQRVLAQAFTPLTAEEQVTEGEFLSRGVRYVSESRRVGGRDVRVIRPALDAHAPIFLTLPVMPLTDQSLAVCAVFDAVQKAVREAPPVQDRETIARLERRVAQLDRIIGDRDKTLDRLQAKLDEAREGITRATRAALER